MSVEPVNATELAQIEILSDPQVVQARWGDGHVSQLPWRYLRGFCPCAHCQGKAPGRWTFNSVPEAVPQKLENVGRYAVRVHWKGGHHAGIYSYELLRTMCPCSGCQQAGGNEHPMRFMPH